MTRTTMLVLAMTVVWAAPVMAQDATGGGGSGGGGGGSVIESPQPGRTKTPTGTSSDTPGMVTPSAHGTQLKKSSTQPVVKKPAPTTGMNELPPNGVRTVAARSSGIGGAK